MTWGPLWVWDMSIRRIHETKCINALSSAYDPLPFSPNVILASPAALKATKTALRQSARKRYYVRLSPKTDLLPDLAPVISEGLKGFDLVSL
jgi:hypothetical protein